MLSGLGGLLTLCLIPWAVLFLAVRRSAARRQLTTSTPGSVFERRPSRGQATWLSLNWATVSAGVGWIGLDTPALNDLPARLVGSRVTSSRAVKSFDDPPSRLRWHSRVWRAVQDVAYGIGAVAVVLGVGIAFVVLLKALVQSVGAVGQLAGWGAEAAADSPARLVKRAAVPIPHESIAPAMSSASELMLRPMVRKSPIAEMSE